MPEMFVVFIEASERMLRAREQNFPSARRRLSGRVRGKPKRKLLENLCRKLLSGDECSQKRKCCDTQLMLSRVVLLKWKRKRKKGFKVLLWRLARTLKWTSTHSSALHGSSPLKMPLKGEITRSWSNHNDSIATIIERDARVTHIYVAYWSEGEKLKVQRSCWSVCDV